MLRALISPLRSHLNAPEQLQTPVKPCVPNVFFQFAPALLTFLSQGLSCQYVRNLFSVYLCCEFYGPSALVFTLSFFPGVPYLGALPSAEQLGELLHGDPDGYRPVGLHNELHNWQEQEQPAGAGLVQLAPGTAGEQLRSRGYVVQRAGARGPLEAELVH